MDGNEILFAFSFLQGILSPEQLIPRKNPYGHPIITPASSLKAYDLGIYEQLSLEWQKIIQYFIGNLQIFRNMNSTPIIKPNKPLDSWFAIYRINQFPKEFIIKWYPNKDL